jgi:GT2 family glycosyltransferase
VFPSAFISYAHEDRAFATWVRVELQSVGVNIFLDHEGLRVGDRLPSALEQAVSKADVFVLIASADGLDSQWTRREFLWAIRSGRRICAIYPTGLPNTSTWPELRDLLAVDATRSLAPAVEGIIRAFPGCDGRIASLDTELDRRNVDLQACTELLQGIAEAIQRHVTAGTWLEDFPLESCILWTASSGAPPLKDTHVLVAPKELNAFLAAQRRDAEEAEVPADRKVRATVLRKSFAVIAQQLLRLAIGSALLSAESPSQAFARTKTLVAMIDHKRLFNYLCLVYDLSRGGATESVSSLLEQVREQCVYAESPSREHRKEFFSTFETAQPKRKRSLSIVVITCAENRAITACLESIERQTHRPDEVVVVEDTPYAGLNDLETHFRLDHHVCLPASPLGLSRRARSRRVGTAMARASVLLYLDGDTVLGPGVVEEVVAWWQERDDAEGSFSLLVPDVEIQPPDSAGDVAYEWVEETLAASADSLPSLSSFSGAGILRSWHDSATLSSSGRRELRDSLSWRNVTSRCWSVARDDVLEVGNWDGAYEGWGTEETDLAYRLHLEKGMRVRILSKKGTYAVHIAHTFDHEARAEEHARNEALLIAKFPALAPERLAFANRLGIAKLVQAYLSGSGQL